MIFKITMGIAFVFLTATATLAAGATDTSFTQTDGSRVLQQYVDVAAPASCLWDALTDPKALKAMGVPMAKIDLRNGGLIEEGFTPTTKPGGNDTIRHRVIAYLPQKLLVLQNLATPPGPPHVELYRNVVQVITLDPLGRAGMNRVRMTISHTGYGTGKDWDQLQAFFRNINGNYLAGVQKYCEASNQMHK